MEQLALFWHRRDLRISDNAGLYKALKSGLKVQAIFIFDSQILAHLSKNDQRVLFIHQTIQNLQQAYQKLGASLWIFHGNPTEIIPQLVQKHEIKHVFCNRDYEPNALKRDKSVYDALTKIGCQFSGSKDHVIFEKEEIVKSDGNPYHVFTPYMKRWKEQLNDFYLQPYPVEKYIHNLNPNNHVELPTLSELGFSEIQTQHFPSAEIPQTIIQSYENTRDFPAINGTTRLSIHLRFGTISIRELAKQALKTNEKYFNELIWRDFYQMILFFYPRTIEETFRKEYGRIEWEFDEKLFQAWCDGKTGYPLVDAGMRELNETGHMHNRVRMVVASFFCKHLFHDWKLGERYFAEKLLDFELASNVGGWQWAAGCGVDAAPYFRIFNPTTQQERFDPQFEYIKKWVPEFGTSDYPQPIVEHKWARERTLENYKKVLKAE
ncbi:cryptochrome/photolyase family protein [Fluviicola taffensis]|uniref:Deoxyribodipyrimidine photo-lyase n=1 Tax=Fluviicola taffensis (strain DSM 16823 / NCIMB 13979 / RW262) TaxID=755732 RepID=F2IK42_FLUTR|nr:deoxyribodipyrimidine photo-lyase [Fluviicola taffensis]AEA42941.1 Deoxyribodipyrimidine photo-lyase [Fluviicola taffensis DSM 16823]